LPPVSLPFGRIVIAGALSRSRYVLAKQIGRAAKQGIGGLDACARIVWTPMRRRPVEIREASLLCAWRATGCRIADMLSLAGR
jgi:hypothetical protein